MYFPRSISPLGNKCDNPSVRKTYFIINHMWVLLRWVVDNYWLQNELLWASMNLKPFSSLYQSGTAANWPVKPQFWSRELPVVDCWFGILSLFSITWNMTYIGWRYSFVVEWQPIGGEKLSKCNACSMLLIMADLHTTCTCSAKPS